MSEGPKTMRIARIALGFVLAVGTYGADQVTSAGRIKGKVIDTGGAAISAAFVMATLQPESPDAAYTPFSATALSDSDGAYDVGGLPAGTYKICVEQRKAKVLNPCAWSGQATLVKVAGSQTVAGTDITVKKGGLLTIRLDDSSKLFKQYESTAGAHMLIGVRYGDLGFAPAELSSQDDSSQELTVLVPYDTSFDISVFSDFFKLADEKGVEYKDKSFKITKTIPPPQDTTSDAGKVVLQVTGKGAW
jgi:hypothetical protein